MRSLALAALFNVACALIGSADAASVFLKALDYDRVEVLIDGAETRTMWVGEVSPQGVALRSVSEESASFDVNGRLWTLRPGQGTYSWVTLAADPHGQFFVTAKVNGTALQALIDTGATAVSLNSEDAERMGIDYRRGRRVVARTASGPATAFLVTLASVQIGDIVVRDVPASVVDVGRRELPIVLVGMSFLRQVEMNRSGDKMVLWKSDY